MICLEIIYLATYYGKTVDGRNGWVVTGHGGLLTDLSEGKLPSLVKEGSPR